MSSRTALAPATSRRRAGGVSVDSPVTLQGFRPGATLILEIKTIKSNVSRALRLGRGLATCFCQRKKVELLQHELEKVKQRE